MVAGIVLQGGRLPWLFRFILSNGLILIIALCKCMRIRFGLEWVAVEPRVYSYRTGGTLAPPLFFVVWSTFWIIGWCFSKGPVMVNGQLETAEQALPLRIGMVSLAVVFWGAASLGSLGGSMSGSKWLTTRSVGLTG